MNNGPIYPGSDYKRTAVIVAVIVLLAAALIMFLGPSNILQLLHLKDLETTPQYHPDIAPYRKPIITVWELLPFVVDRVPSPYQMTEYMFTKSDEGLLTSLFIFPVKEGYQLEIRVENGETVSAELVDLAALTRLVITNGVNGQVYSDFVRLEERAADTEASFPAPND